MKPIILYCSVSGTTKEIAEKAAKELACDLVRVQPVKPYGSYFSSIVRVFFERMRKETPASVTSVPDLSAFDTVLIGYPIWYSDLPAFFSGFLKKCNLQGKTVIPFSTSGTSNIGVTLDALNSYCTGAEIKFPYSLGMRQKDDFEAWIDKIRKL